MIKHCVICGAEFSAPPSSKKITCSPACSRQRKTESHTGVRNAWNGDSRAALSKARRAQGFNDNARKGLKSAMSLPDSQRGENHREAKRWVLIAPDGARHEVVNLTDWARRHAEWFDDVQSDLDRERIALNIRSGFGGIVQAMLGRKKHPCYTYKGWRLGDWPRDKDE